VLGEGQGQGHKKSVGTATASTNWSDGLALLCFSVSRAASGYAARFAHKVMTRFQGVAA
jgi:hypothetical protein